MDEEILIIAGGVIYYPSSSQDLPDTSSHPLFTEGDRATAIEQDILGQFPYSSNVYSVKHTNSGQDTTIDALDSHWGQC